MTTFLPAAIKNYKSVILFYWIVTPVEADRGFVITVIEFWLKDLDLGKSWRFEESGFSWWQQKLRRWKFVQSFLGGRRNKEGSFVFLANECDVTGIESVFDDVTGGIKGMIGLSVDSKGEDQGKVFCWNDVGQLSNWTDSLELPIWKWTNLKKVEKIFCKKHTLGLYLVFFRKRYIWKQKLQTCSSGNY